jgi:ech hydrogenase subunit D
MSDQSIEPIAIDSLLERVRALRDAKARLVQMSATRLTNHIEVTYTFEPARELGTPTAGVCPPLDNLRLLLPAERPWLPSITGLFWCAFIYENELHDLFNIQVDNLVVDFRGTFYNTAVKYAFGHAKLAAATTAVAAAGPAETTQARN